jgi:hypothetical protein
MEIWKKILGLPDRFEVSNFGQVRTVDYWYEHKLRNGITNLVFRRGRTLRQYVNHAKGGYAQVTITFTENGLKKVVSGKVHRLVAKAFIENPELLEEVNHKDSNKLNNHVSNLEWVSRSENICHNYASGQRKPHKKKRAIVATDGCSVLEFESMLAASKYGSFVLASIQKCLSGKAKHHKGYSWKFKDDLENASAAPNYVPPALDSCV